METNEGTTENTNETKRGRGRPKTALKVDARRQLLQVRMSAEEIADTKATAEKVDEDMSEFVRIAVKQRIKKIGQQ